MTASLPVTPPPVKACATGPCTVPRLDGSMFCAKHGPAGRRHRSLIIAVAVVGCWLALFIAGAVLKHVGPSTPDRSTDVASLLAKYDGASSDVAAYSAALDAWQAKCTDTRVIDAGYVDAAYKDEQQNGVNESRLTIMRNLTASVPDSVAPTDCAAVGAAYLVLVERAP